MICFVHMGWGPCLLPAGHGGRHAKASPPLYVREHIRAWLEGR